MAPFWNIRTRYHTAQVTLEIILAESHTTEVQNSLTFKDLSILKFTELSVR